jgi:transcriptional regulator with XRE-family HTH domain
MQPELPKTIDRENLLKFIISIRENAELSETEMAKLAGVAKDTIRDFERGKAQMFRADKLQKLLNAVGYELSITRL